jgi:hypothetical protein
MKSKSFYKQNYRKGQMIVEAIVALSVLTMGFFGILTLLSRSTALTRNVSDHYIATYLAAEGIEIIKSLIDSNVINKNTRLWNEGLKPPAPGVMGLYIVDTTDENPDQIRSAAGRVSLYFDPSNKLYTHEIGGNLPTPYQRFIRIWYVPGNDPDGPEMQVISTVRWEDNGNLKQVILEDHFYNWRP